MSRVGVPSAAVGVPSAACVEDTSTSQGGAPPTGHRPGYSDLFLHLEWRFDLQDALPALRQATLQLRRGVPLPPGCTVSAERQITRPIPAWSIRQPWAWAILHAGKRLENRSRRFSYRGPVWLHASKWWSYAGVAEAWQSVIDMAAASGRPLAQHAPPVTFRSLRAETGGIVGRAQIVDCVEAYGSPWFVGPVAFVLDEVEAVPFVPCKGMLGLFRLPAEVERALEAT